MSFTKARSEYVESEMLHLIDSGVFSLVELSSFFKGMTPDEVFSLLAHKNFHVGNGYLKGIVSSAILKLSKISYDYSYSDIMRELGLSGWKDNSLSRFMQREMKGISSITNEDLISCLKLYAKMIIKHFNSPSELLSYLNWDIDLGLMNIHVRIQKLFETSFEEAKRIHTNHFLNFYF